MKVLIVGGGGREHAIIKKLAESPEIEKLYCAPGNGGTAALAENVNVAATDIEILADWAEANQIGYAVVAPDDPLCMGLVDLLEQKGIPAFGPDKAAARIEGSKVFAKKLMELYGIPTAKSRVFDDMAQALSYIAEQPAPIVVKADGLALGKGVLICQTRAEAAEAVREMMEKDKFGAAGRRILIEEFLTGPEVSVLSFTDGETIVPMVSSMDHKRALDGDRGLNTGGMGVIAPNPYYTEAVAKRCMEEIYLPTVRAMNAQGCPFKGCLYFGLMLTKDGPKVIEYNCRFGDPEAQAVLPLLETDLFSIMRHVTAGTLKQADVRFSNQASCCVVIASGGYPVKYEKGKPVYGLPEAGRQPDAWVFHAGTKKDGKRIVTSGGRVLGVTAVADTLTEAVNRAYATAHLISFDGAYMRHDIGQKALKE
ncbi:MAG: phosphoribosylamine--glycine ligase [Clostridiales bacterium]|nr:phosphoribosylamine--glycine ligase [Clostridiales bacterium]